MIKEKTKAEKRKEISQRAYIPCIYIPSIPNFPRPTATLNSPSQAKPIPINIQKQKKASPDNQYITSTNPPSIFKIKLYKAGRARE